MLELQREQLEQRELMAELIAEGKTVPAWAIVGFFRTRDEASSALDWVRAWRSGS
jgi:hypothetical protein